MSHILSPAAIVTVLVTSKYEPATHQADMVTTREVSAHSNLKVTTILQPADCVLFVLIYRFLISQGVGTIACFMLSVVEYPEPIKSLYVVVEAPTVVAHQLDDSIVLG